MNKKYIYSLVVVGLFLFLSITLGIIYGIGLSKNNKEEIDMNVSGCINIVYSDDKTISMKNPKGQSDQDGMVSTPKTITMTNNCKTKESVELDLDILDKSSIDDGKMHIYVNGEYELGPVLLNTLRYTRGEDKVIRTYQVLSFEMNPNDTKRINLRLWLDENVAGLEEKDSFNARYYIQSGENNIKPLFKELLLTKYSVLENIDYSNIANTEEGLVKIDNNYYLRGNNESNYVKFANHMWRIIGITDKDNIKIIYADGDLKSSYSDLPNQEEKVDYKNSIIKEYLEKWYEENLKGYDSFISEFKYCNDTSYELENRLEYGSYQRVFKQNQPNLNCPSTDKTYGGVIESKIGLITLDEANIIGGTTKENNNLYYLYDNSDYYTMSPAFMGSQAWVGTVTQTGKIDASPVNQIKEVRPVIILNNYVLVNGEGTFDNPYVIE